MTCAFSRISASLNFVLSGSTDDSTVLDITTEEVVVVVACAEEIDEEIEERVADAEEADEELEMLMEFY